ncbi:MAG: PIN domain-containing protein [Candidatus Diapherotrites archaeon]
MAKKFYLDTAIWRDYFEGRSDGLRPLGEFAFRFLKNCEMFGCRALYSELVVFELRKEYSAERIKDAFSFFSAFLECVSIYPKQYREAKLIAAKRRETHESDALHAILARDNNAVLVTRDRHFECLNDLIGVLAPEEVIFD